MDLNMRTEEERQWAIQGFNEMADYYDYDNKSLNRDTDEDEKKTA